MHEVGSNPSRQHIEAADFNYEGRRSRRPLDCANRPTVGREGRRLTDDAGPISPRFARSKSRKAAALTRRSPGRRRAVRGRRARSSGRRARLHFARVDTGFFMTSFVLRLPLITERKK